MRREFPEAPIVGVAGVVIRDNAVLLVRRNQDPLKGEWSLPGGVLEVGETLREGVAREVLEETGLRVQVADVIEVVDRIHREAGRVKYHYVLIDFVCSVVGGNAHAASDAQQARWVSREQLISDGDYKLAPDAARIVEKAFGLVQSIRFPDTSAVDCD